MALLTAIAVGSAVGGGLGWLATGKPKGAAIGALGGAVSGGIGTIASPAIATATGAAASIGASKLTAPEPVAGPIQGAATPGAVQAQTPVQPTNAFNTPPGFPMPMPGMARKRSPRGMVP